MAKAKRSRTSQAGQKVYERVRKAEIKASVANAFIRYGFSFGIAYWAYRVVDTLAGRTTLADIGIDVSVIANENVGQLLAWLTGAGGIIYGLAQRRLRRRTIHRLQGRIRDLETQIDPGRTSSSITTTGQTRPEDRI